MSRKFIILSGLIFCLLPFSIKGQGNVSPVNPLEEIRQALVKETGEEWSITSYNFGFAITASVRIRPESETWNRAFVIICDKNIPGILEKLIDLNMQAPFMVLDYTKHCQIISWASADFIQIQKVIEIAKKADK